jgi:hypothetical protein
MKSRGILADNHFPRFLNLWNYGLSVAAGRAGRKHMHTYDRAPKVGVNWRIIDWTALTDKASGNALTDPNAYVVESFSSS